MMATSSGPRAAWRVPGAIRASMKRANTLSLRASVVCPISERFLIRSLSCAGAATLGGRQIEAQQVVFAAQIQSAARQHRRRPARVLHLPILDPRDLLELFGVHFDQRQHAPLAQYDEFPVGHDGGAAPVILRRCALQAGPRIGLIFFARLVRLPFPLAGGALAAAEARARLV